MVTPGSRSNLYTIFNDIAQAITSKGVDGPMTPSQMATKINQIINIKDITEDYDNDLENITSYMIEDNVGNIYKFQDSLNKHNYTMYLHYCGQEVVYAIICEINKTTTISIYSVSVWEYDGHHGNLVKIFDTLDMSNQY